MSMVCKVCHGLGFIEKDNKLFECECGWLERVSKSMETHIRLAKCFEGHMTHPLTDMVKQSCFIIGSWVDMMAIIKVAILKYYPWLIRITSDAQIKNVFVGDMGKDKHSESFEGEIYNNIQEFMDIPDLMIVQLNKLGSKNKAAAGALEEALIHRFDRNKATWVFSDMDSPYSLGSHAYSDSVMVLLQTVCKPIHIPRIVPRVTVSNSLMGGEQVGEVQPPAPAKKPFGRDTEASVIKKPTQRIQSYDPESEDDSSPLDTIGQGVGKSKKFRSRG